LLRLNNLVQRDGKAIAPIDLNSLNTIASSIKKN
jgi:hypothetical protein